MTILDRHRRLKSIGKTLLQNEPLSNVDREFLGQALIDIAEGSDADEILKIKPKAGENKFEVQKKREVRDKFLFAWLEAATAPLEEFGLGLSRKDAIERLKKAPEGQSYFAIAPETIDRYLRRYPEKRKRDFTLD
jgi:hypothetical protein